MAIGNYLNGSTFKGGAWGFKVDSVERIEEVKSKDSKMNAAFYVIKEVWKKYAYPIFDKEELDLYCSVTKMPVGQLQAETNELKKYALALDKALKSHNSDDSMDHIGVFC